jgi:hypothetical protein
MGNAPEGTVAKNKTKKTTAASAAAPGAGAPPAFHPPIPSVHGAKIDKLLKNRKLPTGDQASVRTAKEKYLAWVKEMDELTFTGDALLAKLVELLNVYKRYIEVDLVYDSAHDFIYRQSGQLKVTNSILEEFLPRLADTRLVPGLALLPSYKVGPQKAFAAFTIIGNVHTPLSDGIFLKEKNQDYAITKKLHVKVSTSPGFEPANTLTSAISVAYFAAEVKTNLDKTMFNEGQEASRALKQAVASARYLLVCEWLDMTAIDTKLTSIDETILLRGKRLGSGVRDQFDTAEGRKSVRAEFVKHMDENPLRLASFKRIVMHLNQVYPPTAELDETTVLERGYF